jgi:ArsR family transcriptional regulator
MLYILSGMLSESKTVGKLYDPVPALKALGHPLRFALLELLAGGEKCVCDLVEEVDASQPLVSHHLAILKRAGLVVDRQEATWAYYNVDRENWEVLQSTIAGIQPNTTPAIPCSPEDASQ